MPKKKAKKKKTPIKTLANKADRLWSLRVRELHGNRCAICGKKHGALNEKGNPSYLNSHHIEGRKNWILRHDILNGIALCPGCHDLRVNSAEQSPIWFVLGWLTNKRPEVINYILRKRDLKIEGNKREYYEHVVARLSEPIVLTDEEKEILNYPASFWPSES